MITHVSFKSAGASVLAVILFSGFAAAKEDVKSVAWSPHGAHPGCHMNMGPTGARAWMRGYQFEVIRVDEGSPADGVLQVGDRVIGVGKTMFSDDTDARMILGNAIGEAEADDGELNLVISRDGKKKKVTVELPVTGPFSATWPYNCSKSQRILNDACVFLREAQFPDGRIITDGGMGTYLGGLLFLASGEARFVDCARRAAYAVFPVEHDKVATPNWSAGYGGVLLGEYYLATGDTNVLGKLQEIIKFLEMGQMQCGSWGHDSPSAVYGGMNQAGIVCAMAISLAEECGLKVDREKLDRALKFYGRYAELGAVPYGDHGPGYNRPDDNGKSASSSILLGLHPEWEKASEVFAESVAASYWLRETGHTGGFFSMMWGPLAIRDVDEKQFRAFMDYQKWYYNLSRTWKGELVMLPYKEALTRFDSSTYTEFWGEFTTGGFGLAFALPHRKLRILGAPRSVFGAKVKGAVAEARKAYMARDWDAFDKAAAKKVSDAEDKRRMAQLKAAKQQLLESTAITAREIENDTEGRDPFRASKMLEALSMELGDDYPALTNLAARLESGSIKWTVAPGEKYYDAYATVRGFSFQGWFPYIDTARPTFKDVPALRPVIWDALLPVAGDEPTKWKVEDGSVEGEREFTLERVDVTELRLLLRAPRNSHTFVSLNGTQIAEITRGQRGGYAKIALDDSTLALLKQGKNVMSLEGTSVGGGNNQLDMGLEGVYMEPGLASTPERLWSGKDRQPITHPSLVSLLEDVCKRAPKVELEHKPDPGIPERVQVRDSYDRFMSALNDACDGMDDKTLEAALSSPVAFWRYLGSQALARKGDAALDKIEEGLNSSDWHVRSAVCDALSSMRGEEEHPAKNNDALVARLVELVSDGNAWVRARAARALGAIGRENEKAAKTLAQATSDSDGWVRVAALASIDKVTDDADLMVGAAADALGIHTTFFGAARRALKLIDAHGGDKKTVIPALVFAIEHPGEGMGAGVTGSLIRKLVELDPDGKTALRVLIKVAKGGYEYDRLQGNPRKVAIELLGGYGPKAANSLPALRQIAAGEEKRNSKYKDSAEAAIELIGKK